MHGGIHVWGMILAWGTDDESLLEDVWVSRHEISCTMFRYCYHTRRIHHAPSENLQCCSSSKYKFWPENWSSLLFNKWNSVYKSNNCNLVNVTTNTYQYSYLYSIEWLLVFSAVSIVVLRLVLQWAKNVSPSVMYRCSYSSEMWLKYSKPVPESITLL